MTLEGLSGQLIYQALTGKHSEYASKPSPSLSLEITVIDSLDF